MNDKVFILFDGRAKSGDTDDAEVLVTAATASEAWRDSKGFRGVNAVWFEYDLVKNEAVNEKRRDDIGKGILV